MSSLNKHNSYIVVRWDTYYTYKLIFLQPAFMTTRVLTSTGTCMLNRFSLHKEYTREGSRGGLEQGYRVEALYSSLAGPFSRLLRHRIRVASRAPCTGRSRTHPQHCGNPQIKRLCPSSIVLTFETEAP